MLNINRCRRILGSDAPESDAELGRIIDSLRAIARVIVERLPEFGPCARVIRRSRMLAGLGSLRLRLKTPFPMLRNGLLSFPSSLARYQVMDIKSISQDFKPEPFKNNENERPT